jgi:hypothetical protein
VRAVAGRVADGADVGRCGLRELAPAAVEGARVDRVQRVHRGQAALVDEVDQVAGVGVKHDLSLAFHSGAAPSAGSDDARVRRLAAAR